MENYKSVCLSFPVICLEGSTFQDEPCVDRYIYHAGLFMLRFKRCN